MPNLCSLAKRLIFAFVAASGGSETEALILARSIRAFAGEFSDNPMHADYPADRRPEYMNELITGRYDVFFQDPNWRQILPIKEPLKGWLTKQLSTWSAVESAEDTDQNNIGGGEDDSD